MLGKLAGLDSGLDNLVADQVAGVNAGIDEFFGLGL